MTTVPEAKDAYIGRFAPSPSGPLHFGSLVAAVASYLDARSHQGSWLLRIDDLDPARELSTAPAEIVDQLLQHGLVWDGDILFQSSRLASYQQARNQLTADNRLYPCTCSRKNAPRIYAGHCLTNSLQDLSQPHAIRFHIKEPKFEIHDRLLGPIKWRQQLDMGDFIVLRKDGLNAYQLAVVVDDIYQGITDVLRGADLIHSTPLQLSLFKALNSKPPRYCHVPVVLAADGRKLSKQAFAETVSRKSAVDNIRNALNFLGQKHTKGHSVNELLESATRSWNIQAVPPLRGISEKI